MALSMFKLVVLERAAVNWKRTVLPVFSGQPPEQTHGGSCVAHGGRYDFCKS